ncbi:MAG: YihY/virulence factor BrkB family protein [Myxococcota bacterium]|nr:YihY/virulence factor BrkB family protein [Myxococcota bacterium]
MSRADERKERARTKGRIDLRTFSGMRAFVGQILRDLIQDDAPHWAAAISYYAILSLFPLLLLLLSVASFFVEPEWTADRAVTLLGDFVPEGASFVRGIIAEVIAARGAAGLLSSLLLLWTGSRVFGALTRALNIMYDVDDTYPLWKQLVIELAMTASLGVVFLVAIASDLLLGTLQALDLVPTIVDEMAGWLAPLALIFVALLLIYRFVPRERRLWRSSAVGAVTATLAFIGARSLFYAYLTEIAQYNLIYGSLAIVIMLMVWAWIVALITLIGGEVASHYQMLIVEGMSPEDVDERHAARAPKSSEARTVP